jgi:mannose-6-phosphate isomerase-like protein (cupin superfamily)
MGEKEPRQQAETEEAYFIENPATGERIRFFEEPIPGGGDVLRFEFWARPHIVGPQAHVHPKQEEYFEVRDGVLSARVGKDDLTLRPGESMTVQRGTPHNWWNSGDEELHGYVELRPSMNMRDEFEALFALGRAGRTDESGVPNLLQVAVLLDTYPDTIYRAGLPIPVQKAGIALLAPIARMLGYKARYPEIVGAAETEIA